MPRCRRRRRGCGGCRGRWPAPARSSPSYEGERYLASSTLALPSGVRRITTSARTPSRPLMRSTKSPSTDASPSTSSPSAVKNAVAAARSSTTMPMCSRRRTVMNGLRPAPAACARRAADTSASWSPRVVGRAARGWAGLCLVSGAGQRFSTCHPHSTLRHQDLRYRSCRHRPTPEPPDHANRGNRTQVLDHHFSDDGRVFGDLLRRFGSGATQAIRSALAGCSPRSRKPTRCCWTPRREIPRGTARAICRQLAVPPPAGAR